MLSGAVQGTLAAVIVFPMAAVIHAPGVHAHLDVHWPVILTMIPLACVAMTSLGLLLGTTFEPRNMGLMFGFVVLPLTFLGGTYYQWTRLSPVTVDGFHWLQTIVLINPLIYVAEGMRAGLTNISHMPLYVIYPVLTGFLRGLSRARAAELQAPRPGVGGAAAAAASATDDGRHRYAVAAIGSGCSTGSGSGGGADSVVRCAPIAPMTPTAAAPNAHAGPRTLGSERGIERQLPGPASASASTAAIRTALYS